MTRRLFFRALAGATVLFGAAKRMVAKPKTEVIHFPAVLRKGDRLSVSFSGTPSDMLLTNPVVAVRFFNTSKPGVTSRDRLLSHRISARQEGIFIAAEEYIVADAKVFYATPSSKPAPILWMKTSAGE